MRAILREVTDALGVAYGCDVELAREQHEAYAEALRAAGAETVVLPADPTLADACFIEDTAILDGERALVTHMGREDRRPECAEVGRALAALGHAVSEMQGPPTLEGGDVLRTADRVFVGLSTRTNAAGLLVLQQFLDPLPCIPVAVRSGCVHLKSACSAVADGVVLLDARRVDAGAFTDVEIVALPEAEPHAANTLRVGDACILPSDAPETLRVLERRGLALQPLDVSEFRKADGALTCLSLLSGVG